MGVIANVQGFMIVNRLLGWISYTDCSVTSVGHAALHVCLPQHVSIDFCYYIT